MKGPISLAQELRAIRKGDRPNGDKRERPAEVQGDQRPWQADIDQMQQSMQELLRSVTSLLGVEIPGLAADPKNPAPPSPQLDFKTIKSRIRNDLETFSSATAAEITKRTQEQSRAALETIQNDVGTHIDHVVGEFREKLRTRLESEETVSDAEVAHETQTRVLDLVQARTDEFARWVWLTCKGTQTPIPAQIGKLLEPHAEQATAQFVESSRQRFQDVLTEQERFSQDLLQGMEASFKGQMNSLVQTTQQECQQNLVSAMKSFMERLNLAGEEATQNLQSTMGECVDASIERFRRDLAEMMVASHQGLQAQAVEFQAKLAGMARETFEKSLSEEQLSKMRQEAVEAVQKTIQQTASSQHDEINKMMQDVRKQAASRHDTQLRETFEAQYAAALEKIREGSASITAEIKGMSERVMQEVSEKVEASTSLLKEEAVRTTSSIESSFKLSLESYRRELAECTESAVDEQRRAISVSVNDLQDRLKRSAQLLRGEIGVSAAGS